MLHANYMTSNVSKRTGHRRIHYQVWLTKAEVDALYENAATRTGRGVIEWYDRDKRELSLRRAGAAEKGRKMAPTHGVFSKEICGQNLAGGSCCWFVYGGRKDGFDIKTPYTFRASAPKQVRVVKVHGVPHLVWKLPEPNEVKQPRGKYFNRQHEPLYNPDQHQPSDVRLIIPAGGKRAVWRVAAAVKSDDTVLEGGPKPVYVPRAAKAQEAAKPAVELTPPLSNGAVEKTPLERLKTALKNVNVFAPLVNAKLTLDKDGKLHAKIVTEVEL